MNILKVILIQKKDLMMYYLDYWNKKGTDKEYDEDPRCEEFPLE